MKICVVGHTGFIGQTVYSYFINKYKTFGINSKTKKMPSEKFDVIINCAGNSKKYSSEKNINKVILANKSIINNILKLKTKKIIHISSIDASFTPDNSYTISKLNFEKLIKSYFSEATILRLGGLVGPGLKKNVVFDIKNNKNLFVTLDSIYNYISTKEVAKIIHKIIELNIHNKIINICSNNPISVQEIINEALKHSIIFTKKIGNKKENYTNININNLKEFFTPKDSKYYINKYFTSCI